MATDTSTWTNYWNSEDYNEWKSKADKSWGDTALATYTDTEDRKNYGWEARSSKSTGSILGGAAAGAVAGSALGGIGAVVGGLLGGLFGWLFGGSSSSISKAQYNSYLDEIVYGKENLTTEYNRQLEDLKTERDRKLEQYNTLNSRYQAATNRTVEARDSQEELQATQIYAKSKENTQEIREAQKSLQKQTASKVSSLATSGLRNTGSASESIAYSYKEGTEKIENAKYQMDVDLFTSNSQMASNYASSTYTAYGYQDSIKDNVTEYSNWLEDLETALARLKEDYESQMEQYNSALERLKETQDSDDFESFLSGLTTGFSNKTLGLVSGLLGTIS